MAEYYSKNSSKENKHSFGNVRYKPELFSAIVRVYNNQVELDRFRYSCLVEKSTTYENSEI